jgi:hypothetical protein
VDHVTLKDEEDSKATVVKTAEGIEQDIKELLRCGLRMVVSYGSDDIPVFLVQSMRI